MHCWAIIKAHFEFFKKEEGIIKKKQNAFEAEVQRRTKAYEAFITKKDAEARGGLLSQNEIARFRPACRGRGDAAAQQHSGAGLWRHWLGVFRACARPPFHLKEA